MELNTRKSLNQKRDELKLQSPIHYAKSNQSANMQLIDRAIVKDLNQNGTPLSITTMAAVPRSTSKGELIPLMLKKT